MTLKVRLSGGGCGGEGYVYPMHVRTADTMLETGMKGEGGTSRGLLCTPSDDPLVYRVHDRSVGHDTHEMRAETSIQRPCAFFSYDEPERLHEARISLNAIHARLPQPSP